MTRTPFIKPSTTPAQQVALLQSRGVIVENVREAERFLSYHNYYYISGYVFYFETKEASRTHILERKVTFYNIVDLITFDQDLREYFLKAVFTIEVALRSVIAREIALVYGPFGLENSTIYRDSFKHQFLKEKLQNALREHKNEPFISHFCSKYVEPIPPVWVMIEIVTFGTISHLFSHLQTNLQKRIADSFGVDHIILVSWLKALTELRNTCAHHSRLWNKVFVNYPKIRSVDKKFPINEKRYNRLGSFIPVLSHLLNIVGKADLWIQNLQTILSKNLLIKPGDLGLNNWDIVNYMNKEEQREKVLV